MARTVSDAPPNTIFDDISVEELRRRRSYKWREFPTDVLPAFVAEMDFRLAPAVAKSLADAVQQNDAGYALPSDELNQALAGFAKERFGWDLGDSRVVLIPDVMVGITEVLRAAVSPGSGVVINTPVYPPFFDHIVEAGCRVVEAPLASSDGGYEIDLDAIERAFAKEAQAYLLCNPHNPTGLVLSAPQLTRIAELADRYDIVVLADEIHAPLVMAGANHTPFLSLGEIASNRGLALVSASKAWNTPGLKCAQLVVPSGPMQTVVERLPEGLPFRAGHLGVIASIAAYREGVAWLDDLLEVLDRNRRLMADLVSEQLPGVRYHLPQGTYLAWLDCRALDLPEEPVDYFLKRARVAVGPGPKFGSQGRGHVRITMATSEAILREIVDRMRTAIT